MLKATQLYQIYLFGFMVARIGEGRHPGNVLDQDLAATLALAIGIDDGSRAAGVAPKSEGQFAAVMHEKADGSSATEEMLSAVVAKLRAGAKPATEQTEEKQIEAIVADEASKLGSWTTSAELHAKVKARMANGVWTANNGLIFELCERYAKRHNDGLESRPGATRDI
jgi:hypothetical protein